MKIKAIALGALLALVSFGISASIAAAAEPPHKLSRGAINMTTGWAELPMQMAHESSDSNIYQGMTYGFMDGLSTGLKRTMYGVWDFVTFPVPPHDHPVMEPETVFGEAP